MKLPFSLIPPYIFQYFLHSTHFILSQIIRQCSLFDVDMSRGLNRPIFNSKTRILVKKGEKGVLFKMFHFHQFPKTRVSIKSYMTEEVLLNKYHSLNFFFLSTAELQNERFTIDVVVFRSIGSRVWTVEKRLWDLPCLLHLLFWFHVSNYRNFWNNERRKSCIEYFNIMKSFHLQKTLSKWR